MCEKDLAKKLEPSISWLLRQNKCYQLERDAWKEIAQKDLGKDVVSITVEIHGETAFVGVDANVKYWDEIHDAIKEGMWTVLGGYERVILRWDEFFKITRELMP